MTERKLASIQEIAEIREIPGADAIEAVRINGWWCCAKRGEFKVGDLCVYAEVDSLLPIGGPFDFLASRGTAKSELEDGTIVEGYRLKTIRLRGQLSQGLALPWNVFASQLCATAHLVDKIGVDVTELLGIHKYEKPMNAQLRGLARGNFPSFLRKSDQERAQNLRNEIWDAYERDENFQVTVKLDGSSMTAFYVTEDGAKRLGTESRFGVCSRNLELKETEDNTFWKIARQLNLEDKLKKFCEQEKVDCIAVQGELLAPNIQGNFEGVDRPRLFVYNIFDGETGRFIDPRTSKAICDSQINIDYVPLAHWTTGAITLRKLFPDATKDTLVDLILQYADGPSGLNGKFREGLVYKSTVDEFSFKTISNRYLLKTGE